MNITFGAVVIAAGFAGILSFGFLALAIGTEYWYIVEDNRPNLTQLEESSSHAGLWGVNDDENSQWRTEDPYKYSEAEQHIDRMHVVVAVLLPLSLVLLVFGGICGLISSLARSRLLLTCSASYFLLCSLLTLSGVSLYISFSQQLLLEAERRVGVEQMALVHTSFGWSLGVALLSFGLELLTGLLLLLAARLAPLTHYQESVAPI